MPTTKLKRKRAALQQAEMDLLEVAAGLSDSMDTAGVKLAAIIYAAALRKTLPVVVSYGIQHERRCERGRSASVLTLFNERDVAERSAALGPCARTKCKIVKVAAYVGG